MVADPKTQSETTSKVVGYLKKLQSYHFLCLVCCYLDVLEQITPASKIFEAEGLLPYEIKPTMDETISNLNETIEASIDEDMLVSHLSSFRLTDDSVFLIFLKGDDSKKKNTDREKVELELEMLTHKEEIHLETCIEKKRQVCAKLKDLLEEKFSEFSIPVFTQMKWFNPKCWSEESTFGYEEIRKFATFCKEPLLASGYDEIVTFREWKSLKIMSKLITLQT